MANENWEEAKRIFADAIKVAPDERLRFLDKVCDGDKTPRREVESLLASYDETESFMESPAVGEVAEVIGQAKHLENGKCFGHYEIIEQIGAGGMGEVYLAQDKKLDRKVAVKILNEKFSRHESNLGRFTQEAKAASGLNHPNILVIHEIGESENTHYIVSEFIKGETLREIFREKPLKLSEVLDVSIQIAGALCAAHEAFLVHRDIKPENIMVRPDGFVKILDFGLAKLVEQKSIGFEDATVKQNQTAKGVIMGTVNYMSPEQAKGEKVDGRTDIFSFGAVIYEMIAGKTPFAGDSMPETFANLINAEPKPLSHFAANVPDELQRIVSKTLRKNKDERYQTMQGLLTELKGLQKRIEFEAELGRASQSNKQAEAVTQISRTKIFEEITSVSPNNLTINLLPIIGREKAILQLKNLLLQNDARLVTMSGVGGTGKTRLAKAVAREMLPDFSDGVFFVELAAITNPELVASTIAQPLGVKEAGGKPILEALKDYLRDRRMLLVVDNFEQVVDAAPNIAELLVATNNLKILITSRVLLHLSAEKEFTVPPLAVPDETSQISLDELSNYEAIKLFVERARNAKPNFALTNENASDVAEICARLDGLPLAIELAAARIKILSPRTILAKLENRLKLLTGGASDLPVRQQTMRGAVEWSYDLLNEDEKTLFRRLAIFAGGFTFEAVESVVLCPLSFADEENTGSNEQRTIDVLDGITSLIDKSLLVSKEQAHGDMRFRMLEVVREYALESLEKNNEAEALRRRHAAYFLALGEEADQHLQTAQAGEWLNRLEDEHDNLRAAISWLFENDVEKAARLAAAIRIYLINHSHLTEGREWLNAALERSDEAPAAVRFKLLNGFGYLAFNQGDYPAARKMFEEGLAEGGTAGDKRRIAESLRGLGAVAHTQDDYTAARKFGEEGLAIYRELNDIFGIAKSLNGLVVLALSEGDSATAHTLAEESLTNFRLVGNESGICYCLINLGGIAYINGDYEQAQERFAETVTIAQKLGYKDRVSFCLDGFAALAAKRGEWELAARLTGAAEHLREQIGYESELADRQSRNVYLAEVKTQMDEADFARFYEQGRKLKLEEAIALCLEENDGKIQTIVDKPLDERLRKSHLPGAENATKILPATTGDANKTTGETSYSFTRQIRQHKPLAAVALIVLLAAIGFGAWQFADFSANSTQIESIAVLPFENQNSETEYLSDGLTENVINNLTKLPNLRVISRNSVFRYKGKETETAAVGRELNVVAVLTGRIVQRGDNLVISAELTDLRENKQIWGQQYSRKITDAFALQQEISRDISETLRSKLTGEERRRLAKRETDSPEAYQFYLNGRYHWNKRTGEGFEKAIEFFNQAIEKDPTYALAYVGLADSYLVAASYKNLSDREKNAKAQAAAQKALEIDETLGEAHATLANIKYFSGWDWAAAEREYKRAVELSPNYPTAHHWYGEFLATQGRFDESFAEYNRAVELDPLSLAISTDLGLAYYYARQYDRAIEHLKKLKELDPNYGRTYFFLARVYLEKEMFEETITESDKGFTIQGADVQMLAKRKAKFENALRTSGVKAYRQKALEDYVESGNSNPIIMAKHYAGLGERGKAFEFLEKAYEERHSELVWLKVSPQWDSLRDDSHFQDLLRRMGLPQ